MNYLISKFDCVVFGDKIFEVIANVKYKILQFEKAIIFSSSQSIPFMLDLNNSSENVLKVKNGCDNFYFLFPSLFSSPFCLDINFKNKKVNVNLSSKLLISIDGVVSIEKIVENLTYSHHEILGELCLIYFNGKRNFLVVIKDSEVVFANYYDECNINEKEKYFMCKLNDSLNHGSVCHIKDKDCSTYLVYLDDEELKLKLEFVPFVFLDCVKAGNYKYCNALLKEDLKMKEEKLIKDFFQEFDFFYPLNEKKFVLINKNTLAGIYEFDVKDNLISNIRQC